MAKIDTSKIAGYSAMTADEKIAALEAFEMDGADDIDRYKNAAAKANSEAAAYKKQLNETKTSAQTNEQRIAELESKLEAAEKRERISSLTAKYVELGYESNLAAETAEAFANGDTDKVFANHLKAKDAMEQKLRAEIMKGTPRPSTGTPAKAMTLEEFRKLSGHERAVYASENPEAYRQLYSGGDEQ